MLSESGRLVALMLCLYDLTQAGLEQTCAVSPRPRSIGVCGSELSDVVNTLCQLKRNASLSALERSPDERDSLFQRIHLPKVVARRFIEKRQLYERGIVCECCYNQCSIEELTEYCSFSGRSSPAGNRETPRGGADPR